MNGEKRRERILELLEAGARGAERQPLSAARLARLMDVSRQAIVGDIALLRAQGKAIIATARGYMMEAPAQPGRYVGKLACRHSLADTEKELMAVVELGGEVLDVTVSHRLYGDMTGQLNIATRQDVAAFMASVAAGGGRLLLELTGGLHLHTVACRDRDAFVLIEDRLRELGFLYGP
ncbi:MAG: transcription repressor NadR [Clostridiales Family XIII bacterium]|jgi:transcriptional regulator of NAD metabolism|nr:transcription repressor NadR [Clostridiales Family XIII bacterium]